MKITDAIIGNVNQGSKLSVQDIERLVNDTIQNPETLDYVDGATTLSYLKSNKVIFLDSLNDERLSILENTENSQSLFILPKGNYKNINVAYIQTNEPRIIFAKIISAIFDYFESYYDGYYSQDELSYAFPETKIFPGCQIHRTAKIGKGSILMPNVFIGPHCVIGDRALVSPNTTIGQAGFGVIAQDNLEHIHIPHVGGVWIGDNVEIGALNSVASGTIHPTIIESHVKMDSAVHIAHNCYISKGALITAHVEISGSTHVGKGVWIGPNTSIINGVKIGDGAFIGIGTNVTKSIPENVRAIGNPVKILKN